MSEVQERIDRLVQERQALWAQGRPAGSLSDELEKAYDERRREMAAQQHGAAAEIIRRARVERELEKLAGVADE